MANHEHPKRWRLKYGDQVFGPFDRAELEALLSEGRLNRSSLLAAEGEGEVWLEAGDIAELADLFASATVPSKAKPPKIFADQPDPLWLHLVYALYAASVINGLTAIVGVAIAYFKRDDAIGTWQESHYDWQMRTFWFGLLLFAIGFATTFILIGFLILAAAMVWLICRIVKGWVRLGQLRAIDDPTAFV